MIDLLEDPWSVEEAAFPWSGTDGEKLALVVHYAVLAPSGHNTQPWLFEIAGDALSLFADRTRALPEVDPEDRELVMSCGAALFHLRTALRHYGFEPAVEVLPDPAVPDLLARVRIGPRREPSLTEHRLFMAIKQRRTNRMPFHDQPVRQKELAALEAAAREEGARLHVVRDREMKYALADLIAEGDRMQGASRSFRRELAAWVHPNRSRSRDGIPGYAQDVGDILSYAGPFVVRTFDWGEGQAARDRQLAEGSPVLLVLGTEGDAAAAWFAAGQALDRVLLQASEYGLSASFLNQPIEVSTLRAKVGEALGLSGYPQLILRMGYGRAARATPRRPVREVLVMHPEQS